MLYDPSGRRISAVTRGGISGLVEEKLYEAEASLKKALDRALYGGALLYDADGRPIEFVDPQRDNLLANMVSLADVEPRTRWSSMTTSIDVSTFDPAPYQRIIAP